jgi:protein-tyrosine phosphatase
VYRILFVCTGNICRSPTAEGITRDLLAKAGLSDVIELDSAGLYDGHAGQPPDALARLAARSRGYTLDTLRARGFRDADFHDFDLILGMDGGHVHDMRIRADDRVRDRVRLFNDMSRANKGKDVPDPYGRSAEIYQSTLNMIDSGCRDLVDALIEKRPDRS